MPETKEVYTLGTAAKQTRDLANQLFKGPCTQKVRCMQAEEERPLTREERVVYGLSSDAIRCFWAYDPFKMCARCRVYWLAEMAAQEAHKHACLLGAEKNWLEKD